MTLLVVWANIRINTLVSLILSNQCGEKFDFDFDFAPFMQFILKPLSEVAFGACLNSHESRDKIK